MSMNKRAFSFIFYVVMVSVTLLISIPVLGAPQLSNNDAIKIIENGMSPDYVYNIPTGNIVITRGLLEKHDPKNHVYKENFLKMLNWLEKAGFILLKDTTNKFNMSEALGDSKYNIIFTEKGKKYALGTNDQGDYMLRTANVKVIKIVKNSGFTPAFNNYPRGKMDRSADYRLVLGTFNIMDSDVQNEISTAIGYSGPKVRPYKFKALLQYDPFNEKYKYLMKDVSNIDKDDWHNTIK